MSNDIKIVGWISDEFSDKSLSFIVIEVEKFLAGIQTWYWHH